MYTRARHFKKFLLFLFTYFSLLPGLPLSACTIWGATGSKTQDGMTLVAKNRDWKPDNVTTIKTMTPEKGFRYLGLFASGGASTGLKGGINQEGLAIVSASASTVSDEEGSSGKKGLNGLVLTRCKTVASVLADEELLSGLSPNYYLLGDRNRIALIEVAPGGEYSVEQTADGALCHTNHYFFQKFQDHNEKSFEGSGKRLDRIRHLLEEHGGLLTLQDFVSFSEDRNDGPDQSIWREGSEPGRARTLASWIVALPKSGCPELHVKLANPDEEETQMNLKLNEAFWGKAAKESDEQ
jgi:isopenicillin-N N-acyltransferase like protein